MSNEPIQAALPDYETFPPNQVLIVPEDNHGLHRRFTLEEVPRELRAKISITYIDNEGHSRSYESSEPLPILDTTKGYREDLGRGGFGFKVRDAGRGKDNPWAIVELDHPFMDLADQLVEQMNKTAPHVLGGHHLGPGEMLDDGIEVEKVVKSYLNTAVRMAVLYNPEVSNHLNERGISNESITGVRWDMPMRLPAAPPGTATV